VTRGAQLQDWGTIDTIVLFTIGHMIDTWIRKYMEGVVRVGMLKIPLVEFGGFEWLTLQIPPPYIVWPTL